MTVTITRTPRSSIIARVNECTNPRLGSQNGWTSSGYGVGGTGTQTYNSSTGELSKSWTNNPSNTEGAGVFYRHPGWGAGLTKTVSADIYPNGFEPKMSFWLYHYNSSGVQVGLTKTTPTQLYIAGGWQRISGTATAPAGTAYTEVQICISAGNMPGNNQGFALRRVLFEQGSNVQPYFDGGTYPNGNGTTSTAWEGAVDLSRSFLYDWDPNNVIVPALSEGWDQVAPGRTGILDLLDNTTGLVLQPIGARRGTLKLYFGGGETAPEVAREAAVNALAQFGQPSVFTYLDDTLGSIASFTFAIDTGGVRLYVAESRKSWRVEAAYQVVL